MKFDLQSDHKLLTGLRKLMKRLSTLMKDELSSEFDASRSMARETMQVKSTPYRFTCLRPSLTCHGPK